MLKSRTAGRMTARLLLAVGAWLCWTQGCVWAATNQLVVASWNVENLYDTVDDPANAGDDGYTPRGWSRWTEARSSPSGTPLRRVSCYTRRSQTFHLP